MSNKKIIPAYYKGKLYEICTTDWIVFLADKPVQHISHATIRKRFSLMDKLGLATEQCLGIERMPPARKENKPSKMPMVRKSEMAAYELSNKFLSRGLMPHRGV